MENKPEEKNTVTEGKEDWIPDFVKKEMAENQTPEKIREWINEFLSEFPEAFKENIGITAESCFPIHVMHEGRKDVEYDTLCQRMNFIQGVLATYKQNLLSPSEPSTTPVVDKKATVADLKAMKAVLDQAWAEWDIYRETPGFNAETANAGQFIAGYKAACQNKKYNAVVDYEKEASDFVNELNSVKGWYDIQQMIDTYIRARQMSSIDSVRKRVEPDHGRRLFFFERT